MIRIGTQVLAQIKLGDDALVGVVEGISNKTGETASYRVRLASGQRHTLPEGHLLALEMNLPSSSEEDEAPLLSRPRGVLDRRFELPVLTASEDQNLNNHNSSTSRSPLGTASKQKRQRVVDSDEEEAFEGGAKRSLAIASKALKDSQESSQARTELKSTAPGTSLPPTQVPDASQPRSSVGGSQQSDSGVHRILACLASVSLPQGLNGDVARYLMESNRPLGAPSVAQALKDKYTRAQIDKAHAFLVAKGLVECLEDSGKIFWFSQSVLEGALSKTGTDSDDLQRWITEAERLVQAKSTARSEAESRVKQLILAPSDEDLAAKTAELAREIQDLETRLQQVDAFAAEAAKQGKSLAELASKSNASVKAELAFFKRVGSERRRKVMDLVDRVCESKNLKPAARRELMEQMGLELD